MVSELARRYEGSFVANRVTGAGKYDWPEEQATYEGEVHDGRKHGFGRLSFAHLPIVYEGQWVLGERHGEVRLRVSARRWRAERRHRTGHPAQETLPDPILLLPWVCSRGGGFPNLKWSAAAHRHPRVCSVVSAARTIFV
jgi:hypothetical protein